MRWCEWWNGATRGERLQVLGLLIGALGVAFTAWRVLR
jgi:hypothetical protein